MQLVAGLDARRLDAVAGQRAASSMSRLQADAALLGRLAAESFEGPGWDQFVDVLIEYGCAVVRACIISVACVPGRAGVVARGNGVAVTEAAIPSLDAHLSPAGVAHDLLRVLDGLCLGLVVLGGTLGVCGLHVPSAVRVGNDIAVVGVRHGEPPRFVVGTQNEAGLEAHGIDRRCRRSAAELPGNGRAQRAVLDQVIDGFSLHGYSSSGGRDGTRWT